MSLIAVAVGGGALSLGASAGVALAAGVGTYAALNSGGDGGADTAGLDQASAASYRIGMRQQDLAEKQYADAKAMYEEFKPQLTQQINNSLTAAADSTTRSNEAWADYKTTWQPVEQQLAQKSLEMASPARAEQEAQRAASDATGQYDRAQQETTRALTMAGASPEKIAALEASGRLVAAKGVAGAESTARRDTEKAGLAYLDNAARFGRNMASTGIATAQLAGSQGQQAQSAYGTLAAASSAPATTTSSLLTSANSAYGTSGYLAGTAGGLQAKADATASQTQSSNLATVAGLAGMFFSTEKSKDISGEVDGEETAEAIAASPSKKWRYKPGLGDGNTKDRMGPTAESLAEELPETSDGQMVDGIALIGAHHAAIGNNTRRLKRIEKRMGLADLKD